MPHLDGTTPEPNGPQRHSTAVRQWQHLVDGDLDAAAAAFGETFESMPEAERRAWDMMVIKQLNLDKHDPVAAQKMRALYTETPTKLEEQLEYEPSQDEDASTQVVTTQGPACRFWNGEPGSCRWGDQCYYRHTSTTMPLCGIVSAGQMIGRGGRTINALREDYPGVRFHVEEDGAGVFVGGSVVVTDRSAAPGVYEAAVVRVEEMIFAQAERQQLEDQEEAKRATQRQAKQERKREKQAKAAKKAAEQAELQRQKRADKAAKEADAVRQRFEGRRCGHTPGKTVFECDKCKAELSDYVADRVASDDCEPPDFGFDRAGRAIYEFDGSVQQAAAEAEYNALPYATRRSRLDDKLADIAPAPGAADSSYSASPTRYSPTRVRDWVYDDGGTGNGIDILLRGSSVPVVAALAGENIDGAKLSLLTEGELRTLLYTEAYGLRDFELAQAKEHGLSTDDSSTFPSCLWQGARNTDCATLLHRAWTFQMDDYAKRHADDEPAEYVASREYNCQGAVGGNCGSAYSCGSTAMDRFSRFQLRRAGLPTTESERLARIETLGEEAAEEGRELDPAEATLQPDHDMRCMGCFLEYLTMGDYYCSEAYLDQPQSECVSEFEYEAACKEPRNQETLERLELKLEATMTQEEESQAKVRSEYSYTASPTYDDSSDGPDSGSEEDSMTGLQRMAALELRVQLALAEDSDEEDWARIVAMQYDDDQYRGKDW
eukprot:COSAG04_NODE_1132_length_8130_cov_3.223882_2_plen_718_part_00